MCSAEQRHGDHREAVTTGPKNAKPRFGRGFVIPDPLTCHRGGTSREAGVHQAGFCAPEQDATVLILHKQATVLGEFRQLSSRHKVLNMEFF